MSIPMEAGCVDGLDLHFAPHLSRQDGEDVTEVSERGDAATAPDRGRRFRHVTEPRDRNQPTPVKRPVPSHPEHRRQMPRRC